MKTLLALPFNVARTVLYLGAIVLVAGLWFTDGSIDALDSLRDWLLERLFPASLEGR